MTFETEERMERVRSRNEFAILMMKSVVLLNGAAAISILTLVGAIFEKLQPDGSIFGFCKFLPILIFGIGAFAGCCAAGFANISQQAHLDGNVSRGKMYRRFAAGSLVAGLVLFLGGSGLAFYAFTN